MLLDVETKLLFENWSPADFCKKQWITKNHICFLQKFWEKGWFKCNRYKSYYQFSLDGNFGLLFLFRSS